MNITNRTEKGYLIIAVDGRLDAITAPVLEKECGNWIEQGNQKLIFDFAALEYISSAGLRVILATAKKVKGPGGSLALCSLTGLVEEVISVSGFDSFMPVYADVEKAMQGGI